MKKFLLVLLLVTAPPDFRRGGYLSPHKTTPPFHVLSVHSAKNGRKHKLVLYNFSSLKYNPVIDQPNEKRKDR